MTLELKYCELCGRPFCRESIPELDEEGKAKPREKDCQSCRVAPPSMLEEEDQINIVSIRSYRVIGIKMRGL